MPVSAVTASSRDFSRFGSVRVRNPLIAGQE
jgi:hypothetical protein